MPVRIHACALPGHVGHELQVTRVGAERANTSGTPSGRGSTMMKQRSLTHITPGHGSSANPAEDDTSSNRPDKAEAC